MRNSPPTSDSRQIRSRVANRDNCGPSSHASLKTRDRDDWTARLRKAAVPCGPVRTIGEMLADPQLEARGMIASIRHPAAGNLRLMGNPVKLSDTSPIEDTPAHCSASTRNRF